jgi:hypothetical protein
MISGLDTRYDLGTGGDSNGHPLLGRRMPDLDVATADGSTRVFELLHEARPVLLVLGPPAGFDGVPNAGRLKVVDADDRADQDGTWQLPVIGAIAAPRAVLIRPDGHVAWAGDHTDAALSAAIATWC